MQKEGKRVLIPATDESDATYHRYCEEVDAEKMRQLYVAMTRAEDRLYLPVVLHGKKNVHLGEASPMELFLARFHRPLLESHDTEGLYARIREEDGAVLTQFIDRQGKEAGISYSQGNESTAIRTEYVEENESISLIAPKAVTVPILSISATSFTTLSSHSHQNQQEWLTDLVPPHDLNPTHKSRHMLPASSDTGLVFHHILEKIPFHLLKEIHDVSVVIPMIRPYLLGSTLEGWEETVSGVILDALRVSLDGVAPGFCLADLQPTQMYREMPFLFPCEGSIGLEELESTSGFLKGVIDLIFTWNGKYYIADWKTNWLGNEMKSYHEENLEQAMHNNSYFLQADIYAQAWRRYLKLSTRVPSMSASVGSSTYSSAALIASSPPLPASSTSNFSPQRKTKNTKRTSGNLTQRL